MNACVHACASTGTHTDLCLPTCAHVHRGQMLLKRAATWEGMVVGEDSMGMAMRGFSLGSFIDKRSGGAQVQMHEHAAATRLETDGTGAVGMVSGPLAKSGGVEEQQVSPKVGPAPGQGGVGQQHKQGGQEPAPAVGAVPEKAPEQKEAFAGER